MADRAEIEVVAGAFVAARRAATSLPDYPGVLPPDLDGAYAIQELAVRLWPDRVVGWKVGRVPDPQQVALGADRLAGPIFRRGVRHAVVDPVAMPAFAGGFAAVEAEFVAVLGDPAGDERDLDMAGTVARIERVHCGIEIASSPLAAINDLGAPVTVSDFGNNAGLIVGDAIDGWQTRAFEQWLLAVEIDRVVVGSGRGAAMLDGPIGAVRFLLRLAAERGWPMPAGTLVSTGAVTGVHPIAIGAGAIAHFGEMGTIACSMVAARPESEEGESS